MGSSGDSSSLILVGAVHRDPEGYLRLQALLDSVRPQIITVEISPWAVFFRKKYASFLLADFHRNLLRAARQSSHIQSLMEIGVLEEIQAQIELPFEYRTSVDYGKPLGVPVLPVDVSACSRIKTVHFRHLISTANLSTLLKLEPYSLKEKVRQEYSRAAALWKKPGYDPLAGCPPDIRQEWDLREAFMARRIRRAFKSLEAKGGGIVFHVGGWMHLIEGRLYSLLSEFNPKRRLLAWA
jgi:hypothetical protein